MGLDDGRQEQWRPADGMNFFRISYEFTTLYTTRLLIVEHIFRTNYKLLECSYLLTPEWLSFI